MGLYTNDVASRSRGAGHEQRTDETGVTTNTWRTPGLSMSHRRAAVTVVHSDHLWGDPSKDTKGQPKCSQCPYECGKQKLIENLRQRVPRVLEISDILKKGWTKDKASVTAGIQIPPSPPLTRELRGITQASPHQWPVRSSLLCGMDVETEMCTVGQAFITGTVT